MIQQKTILEQLEDYNTRFPISVAQIKEYRSNWQVLGRQREHANAFVSSVTDISKQALQTGR